MKKILLLFLIMAFGCTTDNVDTDIAKTETLMPVGINEDGSFIFPTMDNNVQSRPNGKGKGKKDRVLLLGFDEPTVSSFAVINAMQTPVSIESLNYTLPANLSDNGGFTDWDGDGLSDDYIEYNFDCYFPRSFAHVKVYIDGQGSGQIINNSIAFGATLLGFDDVDGDGDQDIIWEGGNHYLYNQGETYSQYNVGLNNLQEEPTPLSTLLNNLVVLQSVNNPDFIRWNLGEQYEGYVFHVYIEPVTPGDFVPFQTHTYGEWGIYVGQTTSQSIPPNTPFKINWSNADLCNDVVTQYNNY